MTSELAAALFLFGHGYDYQPPAPPPAPPEPPKLPDYDEQDFLAHVVVTFWEQPSTGWYRRAEDYRWWFPAHTHEDGPTMGNDRSRPARAILNGEEVDAPSASVVGLRIDPDVGTDKRKVDVDVALVRAGIERIMDPKVSDNDIALHTSYRGQIAAAWISKEAGNIDSELADYIVQAAVFGTVLVS